MDWKEIEKFDVRLISDLLALLWHKRRMNQRCTVSVPGGCVATLAKREGAPG
jgi:hypothetical protein